MSVELINSWKTAYAKDPAVVAAEVHCMATGDQDERRMAAMALLQLWSAGCITNLDGGVYCSYAMWHLGEHVYHCGHCSGGGFLLLKIMTEKEYADSKKPPRSYLTTYAIGNGQLGFTWKRADEQDDVELPTEIHQLHIAAYMSTAEGRSFRKQGFQQVERNGQTVLAQVVTRVSDRLLLVEGVPYEYSWDGNSWSELKVKCMQILTEGKFSQFKVRSLNVHLPILNFLREEKELGIDTKTLTLFTGKTLR